jgi:hypothetical protein
MVVEYDFFSVERYKVSFTGLRLRDCVCSDGSNTPVIHKMTYNTLSGVLTALPTKSDSSVMRNNSDSYIAFIGIDLSEKKLKDLLKECLPQVTVIMVILQL